MSRKEQALAEIVAEVQRLPEDANWDLVSDHLRIVLSLEKARTDSLPGNAADVPELQGEERQRFIAAISEGREQIARGEVISHEEVKRQVQSWFQK